MNKQPFARRHIYILMSVENLLIVLGAFLSHVANEMKSSNVSFYLNIFLLFLCALMIGVLIFIFIMDTRAYTAEALQQAPKHVKLTRIARSSAIALLIIYQLWRALS